MNVERSTLDTQNANPALIRLIRAEIKTRGPISFADFMRLALYHREHGYYSSGHCAIGRKGDFFTNVSVGPLFGELLTAQFAEIWERLGEIDDFVIVEQGAHDGRFARDVLEFAQKHAPQFFAALRYRIVEPFPILQQRQSRTLHVFRDKIEWCDSLQPFSGVHFSNELLDAMPARLISGGMERLVDIEGDKFVFVKRAVLPGDGVYNQATLDWIDEVAAKLQHGYVIAIDYGRYVDKFERTVQVRARHRNLDTPFDQIGLADITMHIDWSSIVERAQAKGLHVAGFTDQHHFLTGIISSWPDFLESGADATALNSPVAVASADRETKRKNKRALQTLMHPEMLGRAFQVLGLEKNVRSSISPLAGFKFAREIALR